MAVVLCEPEISVTQRRSAPFSFLYLRLLILAWICFLLFFFRLGDRDLSSSHEARAAQDAQSMLNSGQWDMPRLFDGQVEMQKPPLYYWLVALLGELNGGQVDAWCVRLPAALSALGTVLLLLAWGYRRGRPLAGYLAALILSTSLHFTAVSRIGRIDMVLTFTVALTLVGFAEGFRQRRKVGKSGWQWFLIAYLAIAAGIMLKGPIAVALPIAVGATFVALEQTGRKRERWSLFDPIRRLRFRLVTACGVLLVLALTLPWYLWANHQTDGEFFRVFFWHHNIDRGFGTEESLRVYPWWYYGPQVLVDLLPWSLVLPFAVWSLWRRSDRDARFGAVWFATMLVLLSCMRFKRSDYLLPAFPGIAWMLGCVAEQWYLTKPSRRLAAGFAVAVCAVAGAWLGYLTLILPAEEASRTHRRFAEEIRRRTDDRVLFFWAEAHLIAFHIGTPMTSFVEWDRLDAWAGLEHSSYVVMPVSCLPEARRRLTQGGLEAVLQNTDLAAPLSEQSPLLKWASKLGLDMHERSYVLVRTHRRADGGP
jgi:4-amino-4-deoxy-L-arabinose transferase-like glycosyltransferase